MHLECEPSLSEAEYQKLVEQEGGKFTCSLCDDAKIERLIKQREGCLLVEYQGLPLICPAPPPK